MKRTEEKVHYSNFHIAGFGYWRGCEAFEHLKIGTELKLVREEDNGYDPEAVEIWYGDFKLGYIPRGNNREISKFLDMGWDNIFEVRITRITPDAHPESQVEVVVYIKNGRRDE